MLTKTKELARRCYDKMGYLVAVALFGTMIDASTINAFAVSGSSLSNSLRIQIRPFLYLIVGLVTVFNWLKGRVAIALVTLIAGLFFVAIATNENVVSALVSFMASLIR